MLSESADGRETHKSVDPSTSRVQGLVFQVLMRADVEYFLVEAAI